MKITDSLTEVWKVLGVLIERDQDYCSFIAERFAAIEDRLARLDGGPASTEARSMAYESANRRREESGQQPLGFKLNGLSLQWTAPDTVLRPRSTER